MAAYERDQTITLSTTFRDAEGDLADPSDVVCMVEMPDGTQTTYNDGTTPAVSNPSVGAYQIVIPATQSGMVTYRWVGTTGQSVAVDQRQLHVLLSPFPEAES